MITAISFAASDALPAHRIHQRRSIDRQTAQALEKLAHAIEYLTSEFLHNEIERWDGRLEAIELLRCLNREIYFTSPQRSTLRIRATTLLHHIV